MIAMSSNAQGVLWALLASLLYASAAAMAKFAIVDFHVLQILLFRQIVVFLSVCPRILRDPVNNLKTRHPWMHAARLAGAFVSLSCGIWAVAVLPLTTAITLGFAQVFFLSLLAIVILGEKVGLNRALAIMFGFIGVLIVMRPESHGLLDIHALIPLLGAMGAGVAVICVRKLSQTESTATLLAYQSTFVGVLAAIPLIWLWATPSFSELLFLLSMGAVATAGQWSGVQALRTGEASFVGNIQYSQIVYSTIFGYVFFSEMPDAYTFVGASIIVASAIFMMHREGLNKASSLKT
jgi:drug/metabolite transporter (DMT)-like permease